MAPQTPWFQRTFSFDLPASSFPQILERLRAAPDRLEERLRSVSSRILVQRDGERWSIQENAGHLLDLEPLFNRRLDDFLAGAAVLTPADLDNRKTDEADHNARSIIELLAEFRVARMRLIGRLEGLDAADLERTVLHPRLQQPMRIVDQAFFIAEHDDHHLARITELLAAYSQPEE